MTGIMVMGDDGRKNGLPPFVWGTAVCLLLLPAVAMLFRKAAREQARHDARA